MTTKELGNLGEKLACEYLVKKGFKILGKNNRITFGEIDIIARKKWQLFSRADRTIHFVEVKTIVNADGFFPEEHVNYKKQQKLRNLAQIWLQKNKFNQDYPCQIDVIGILVNADTKNAKLNYFPNAIENR
jgi:putative endonuclease